MSMHSKGRVVHQRLHCAADPSERAFPCSAFSFGRRGCGYHGTFRRGGRSGLNTGRFFHTVIVQGLQKSWCRFQLYRWKLWMRRNQTRSSLWVLSISVGIDLDSPMVQWVNIGRDYSLLVWQHGRSHL